MGAPLSPSVFPAVPAADGQALHETVARRVRPYRTGPGSPMRHGQGEGHRSDVLDLLRGDDEEADPDETG
ncbi:hypothetical protein GCM10017673_29940 [Streptosporangium violaceochromogenes]|nr:hypothetical protein GCM10017673_29940 [Streptosporangium violaceochromogenes]